MTAALEPGETTVEPGVAPVQWSLELLLKSLEELQWSLAPGTLSCSLVCTSNTQMTEKYTTASCGSLTNPKVFHTWKDYERHLQVWSSFSNKRVGALPSASSLIKWERRPFHPSLPILSTHKTQFAISFNFNRPNSIKMRWLCWHSTATLEGSVH